MNTTTNPASVDDLARSAPSFDDLDGPYDWSLQRRNYGPVSPVAYKLSTQTFNSSGQPKDSDKDYDK